MRLKINNLSMTYFFVGDSDAFVAELRKQGIEVVIPPRSNRLHPREYDRYIYKVRNEVERFINKLKQLRRVATR